MARMFIDGFESGELPGAFDSYVLSGSYPAVTSAEAKSGTYSLVVQGPNAHVTKNFASRSFIYFKMDIWPVHDGVYDIYLLEFTLGGVPQISIDILHTGKLEVKRGSFIGTIIATSDKVIIHDTWNRLEGKIVIDNTNGQIELRLNGTTVINFKGDTQALGSNTIDGINVGQQTLLGSYPCYVDNFILDDAEWIGQGLIQALVPVGEGAATEWTPTEGYENYECTAFVPPSETEFINTNETDKLDLYTARNLVAPVSSIRCVQVQAITKAVGGPVPTHVQLALRTNDTNYLSGEKTPGLLPTVVSQIWQTNPDTLAAWKESEINGMEIGIKAVA